MVLSRSTPPPEAFEEAPDFKVVSRRIVVALAKGKHFRKVGEAFGIIPPLESPSQADPFLSLSIAGGALSISTSHAMYMGSWFASNEDYTFRWDGKGMRLETASSVSYHRGSGEASSIRVDYPARRIVRCQRDSLRDGEDMLDICILRAQIETILMRHPATSYLEEIGPEFRIDRDADSVRQVP